MQRCVALLLLFIIFEIKGELKLVTFSLNEGISTELAVLVYNILNDNVGMIRNAVNMSVPAFTENRSGIIAKKIDIIKNEVWHMVVTDFKAAKIRDGLSYEEGVEHYVKRTLKSYMKSLYKKPSEEMIDIDILDGRNSEEDVSKYGNKAVIFDVRSVVAESQRQSQGIHSGIEHVLSIDEFRKFVIELYLVDQNVFGICKELVQAYSKGSVAELSRGRLKDEFVRLKKSNNVYFNRFLSLLKGFVGFNELEQVFKDVDKMKHSATFVNKEKDIDIEYYNISEFMKEGGILSCAVGGTYSEAYFDLYTCKMRGKNGKISKVDMETSICKVSDRIKGKKVYKLRVEDYLQYALDKTNVFDEGIDTDLINWCGNYYIFVLPSGVKTGFCGDIDSYMVQVKLELLANLVYKYFGSESIIAMDDSYVYFSMNTKPRFSVINAIMYNGKVVRMKISEANNFVLTNAG